MFFVEKYFIRVFGFIDILFLSAKNFAKYRYFEINTSDLGENLRIDKQSNFTREFLENFNLISEKLTF